MKPSMRFNTMLGIIIILLSAFLIYQILLKIFGGSLTAYELAGGLLVGIAGYCFRISNKVSKIEGKFEQFEKRFTSQEENFRDKFERLMDELKEIKKELKAVRSA